MTTKKSVLIISYYWPPAGGPGVQRWLKFAKYLPSFNWEPIIYTPENPNYPIIDNSLLDEIPKNIKILKTRIWEPYQLAEKLSKNNKKIKLLTEEFQKKVLETTYLAGEQLYERYNFQKTALAKQFPFMKGNNLWKGLGDKKENDEVGEAINSGTLAIGFVGGANAMYALFDAEHGTSEVAYNVLYDTIEKMGKVADEFRDKYHLNYSILATPAESLAGRFLRIDRDEFGVIKNVTDRDYYVNSFHIDVKKEISLFDKIRKEAPFHKLTRGGHITYVELDGEARKNIGVMLKIVKVMKDSGIGYGSINHPVDRCRDCGTEAIIYDKCPICGSHNISRIRRITGYLTGDLDSWNSAKQAEEHDRVKHGIK